MDKSKPDQGQNGRKEASKKVASNGSNISNGHELSTELNDLIFELVETINHMGLAPADLNKGK